MATKPPASLSLVKVSPKSQEALLQYVQQCKSLAYRNWNIRETMRNIDIQYARENDYTDEQLKARTANRYGNTNKFQNIVVPVILPAVESAVTYQSSVFLSGIPLFGVVSSNEYIDQAKQLETIIDTQATRGGWAREFMMGFRDAFKYNFAAFEVDWCREMLPGFETDVSSGAANSAKLKQVAWEGNVVRRLDPYNTFWDNRYAVTEVATKGEFAGYSELISRIELKKYVASTPNIISSNILNALESETPAINIGTDTAQLSYYIPQISQTQTVNVTNAYAFNWMAWALLESQSKTIDYKNIYEKTTMYCRVLPADFSLDVPAANTPQIWKLVYINQILMYAQPLSFAYDVLPVLFLCPNEDGLKLQTKSLAQNQEPFQAVATAMMNSVIHSRRRAISDRVLYDPSRVSEEQINSDNPSAKIKVRPAAYGKNIAESVYAFPFRDDQSTMALSEIANIIGLGNELAGQNKAKQGQFVKGNKTTREYQSVMANANGRDQMISLLFEVQFFTPLKELLKINILQYQTAATLYSRSLKVAVTVDPVALRKASLVFKLSDGLIPSEKLINGDVFQTALQVIGSSPQIAGSYNLGPMFSYMVKTQGADIAEFEKPASQVAYEQAMGQWQQAVQGVTEQAIKAGADLSKLNYPKQPLPADYQYTPGQEGQPDNPQQATILAQFQQQQTEQDGPTST